MSITLINSNLLITHTRKIFHLNLHANILQRIVTHRRSPHSMHEMFFARAKEGKATPFAQTLYNTILFFEKQAKELCNEFESPLHVVKLMHWESYANDLSKRLSSKDQDQQQQPPPPEIHWLLFGMWLYG